MTMEDSIALRQRSGKSFDQFRELIKLSSAFDAYSNLGSVSTERVRADPQALKVKDVIRTANNLEDLLKRKELPDGAAFVEQLSSILEKSNAMVAAHRDCEMATATQNMTEAMQALETTAEPSDCSWKDAIQAKCSFKQWQTCGKKLMDLDTIKTLGCIKGLHEVPCMVEQ